MCELPLEFNDPVRETIHVSSELTVVLPPGGAFMTFVWCPPGKFMMGSPETEVGHYLNETLHEEIIESGFWTGKYPVTREQYESLTGKDLESRQGDALQSDCPAVSISHQMAEDFCGLLTAVTKDMGYTASLPTSTQWEYACRAGCASALNNGTEICFKFGRCWNLEEVAWNPLDKVECAQPVGKKKPNAWGIYDMHGNVLEWCREKYIHVSKKNVISERGEEFIVRGGSFRLPPKYHRAACVDGRVFATERYSDGFMIDLFKDIGFRIVLAQIEQNR